MNNVELNMTIFISIKDEMEKFARTVLHKLRNDMHAEFYNNSKLTQKQVLILESNISNNFLFFDNQLESNDDLKISSLDIYMLLRQLNEIELLKKYKSRNFFNRSIVNTVNNLIRCKLTKERFKYEELKILKNQYGILMNQIFGCDTICGAIDNKVKINFNTRFLKGLSKLNINNNLNNEINYTSLKSLRTSAILNKFKKNIIIFQSQFENIKTKLEDILK